MIEKRPDSEMDVEQELLDLAARCDQAEKGLDEADIADRKHRLMTAVNGMASAWSGSWIGYQALVYTRDFRPRQAGEHYDSEWGSEETLSNKSNGDWCEYAEDDIRSGLLRRAECDDRDLEAISRVSKTVRATFEEVKFALAPILNALLESSAGGPVRDLRESLGKLESYTSESTFLEALAPRQVVSRDSRAMQVGIAGAPHITMKCWIMEQWSAADRVQELGQIARRVAGVLATRRRLSSRPLSPPAGGKVFIGHGHSAAWRELKTFLQDRLGLECDEFTLQSAAGLSHTERLEQMLGDAAFAFLVMTAEDEHADGSRHARENVIHEAGLLQGRLGFRRAIILLEEGCSEFSNIAGLGRIHFQPGRLAEKTEEIRQVLERQGLIQAQAGRR